MNDSSASQHPGRHEPQQQTEASSARHLTTLELALRWSMSPRSLERWRRQGIGPRYVSLPRKVIYRISDIEAFEMERLQDRTGGMRAGT